MNIQLLFEELYKKNKYVITIYNTIDNDWIIYMFKNERIQLDIQTPTSLSSSYIDINQALDYIEKQESSIKIKYTYYDDDYKHYSELIQEVLENIKTHYAKHNKEIIIKRKFYY
jgi:hypothetical protein